MRRATGARITWLEIDGVIVDTTVDRRKALSAGSVGLEARPTFLRWLSRHSFRCRYDTSLRVVDDLTARHQRPRDARYLVRQRHGDQSDRPAQQEPSGPCPDCAIPLRRPVNHRRRAENQQSSGSGGVVCATCSSRSPRISSSCSIAPRNFSDEAPNLSRNSFARRSLSCSCAAPAPSARCAPLAVRPRAHPRVAVTGCAMQSRYAAMLRDRAGLASDESSDTDSRRTKPFQAPNTIFSARQLGTPGSYRHPPINAFQ
jgi:hypothetical protein